MSVTLRNLVASASTVAVASSKTLLASVLALTSGYECDSLYFSITNNDGAQTFSGTVETSYDGNAWTVSPYAGLASLAAGATFEDTVSITGRKRVRLAGNMSGAGGNVTVNVLETQSTL